MTVLEAIQRSSEFLARKGVESPRLQAELLLAEVLQVARMKLYLNFERALAEGEADRYRELIVRRGAREPLQHIVGTVSFHGLEFAVDRRVLIPRPETELLAEQAIQWIRARGAATAVLDFGTGSGCLAIVMAVLCPNSSVLAMDVSTDALEVARANAIRHEVGERVRFLHGDGISGLAEGERFDLVVSNPPYIPAGEIAALEPEVRDHDPRAALDGGEDGLDFYRLLSAGLPARMNGGGTVMMEFGDGQGAAIAAVFNAHGWEIDRLIRDYSGRERILIARRSD